MAIKDTLGDPETFETERFVRIFDKFFDCLNVHSFTECFEKMFDHIGLKTIPDLL